jgi:hypothetical protein
LTDQNAALARHHSNNNDTVLRGAAQMAEALNLPRRSIEHLLQTKRLQSPRKIGGSWFVSRSKLLREIVGD